MRLDLLFDQVALGDFDCVSGSGGDAMTDIGVTKAGKIYGVSQTAAYPLSLQTGKVHCDDTWTLPSGSRFYGLTVAPENTVAKEEVLIAVNVAGPQFAGGNLDRTVGSILAEAGLPAEYLEIEVTEGVFLGGNVGEVADALGRLHRRGVAIVLDDFGTGYASLTHLRRFPIDKLKIDRSFVSGVLQDPNDAAIVRAIIDLGHSLGLQVVAEGVETLDQLEFLERHLCDQVQGFLIATPAPATEALAHANAWGRPTLAGCGGRRLSLG